MVLCVILFQPCCICISPGDTIHPMAPSNTLIIHGFVAANDCTFHPSKTRMKFESKLNKLTTLFYVCLNL